MADLSHFGYIMNENMDDEVQWSRFIVHEQLVATGEFVDSVADGLISTEQSLAYGMNSCCNLCSNSKLVSPWVYEFAASCPAFISFLWPVVARDQTIQKPTGRCLYHDGGWAQGEEGSSKGSISTRRALVECGGSVWTRYLNSSS